MRYPCLSRIGWKVGLCFLIGLAVAGFFAVAQTPSVRAASTLTVTNCSNDTQLQTDVANASPGDTITFDCSGVGPFSIPITSTLVINTDLTLDGGGQNITLDGNNAVQVMFLNGGYTLTLNRVTIAHGSSTTTAGGRLACACGGGLYDPGGAVIITNSTFTSNSATDSGGGIYTEGITIITNSTFTNNSATAGSFAFSGGGGIYSNGAKVIIRNSTIANNSAIFSGGGLFNYSAVATITNSTFANNSAAASGGGLYNYGGTVTITSNSTFANNSAAASGGGLSIDDCGVVNFTNSTLSGNVVSNGSGGGIYAPCGSVNLTSSTVANNSASSDGGGLYTPCSTVFITSSTVANNSATNSGGGLYNSCSEVNIRNSTVANNSASSGGGLYNGDGGTVSIEETLLANTTGGNCSGGIGDLGENLSNDFSCGLTDPSDRQAIDPELDPAGLQSNGGPTQTWALQPGSPAIDAIPSFDGCPLFDQRAYQRLDTLEACDIGAYQSNYQATDSKLALINVPDSFTVTAPSSQGPTTVTYTPPTVVDGFSPLPTVFCNRASGSLFGFGPTLVTCGAADNHYPYSPVTASFVVTVIPPVSNVSPAVISLPDATINEGDLYSASGSFTDPDSTSWTATVDYGDGSGSQPLSLSAMTFALSHPYVEEGTYTVIVTVTDNQGAAGTGSATVTVTNAPFTVSAITAPITPTPVNTAITASATVSDPGALDTHTAVWNWGDGTTSPGTVTETNGSGSVQDSHAYSAAGVYTVTLTVTDDDGLAVTAPPFQYVVVYDPSAGFVSGGGWFTSPAGAYPANPTLTGKLRFGFDVKYQAGSSVPTGSSQCTFQAANLTFQSSSYQWLVVAGASAQFQGTGTINGTGNYTFQITVVAGSQPGGGGTDLIRIKIWETVTGQVIYDSQPGAPATATPTTALGGGQITIH